MLAPYSTFESGYTGGLFVAAADLDGDGRAEVIVSPDRGGGGRVTVLAVNPARLAWWRTSSGSRTLPFAAEPV